MFGLLDRDIKYIIKDILNRIGLLEKIDGIR